ncbi:hypothetical protein GOBAR_DD34863 [Gossypium barbadense]|nr:hypothetical protein GOBAR_DD34863 [Gossypium barbadense]
MGNEPFSTACKLAGLVHLLQEHVAANSVLNVDGSWDQVHHRAGSGGVIRDCHGNWIVGFGSSHGNCNIEFAKLLGLYHGLELAWSKGINQLEVGLGVGELDWPWQLVR